MVTKIIITLQISKSNMYFVTFFRNDKASDAFIVSSLALSRLLALAYTANWKTESKLVGKGIRMRIYPTYKEVTIKKMILCSSEFSTT